MSQLLDSAKHTVSNLIAIPSSLGKAPPTERRASVFGMIESGKTTTLGLLEITCVDYANRENRPGKRPRFQYLVQERTSGIRQAAAELRLGMFPEKTGTDRVFEADFIMRFHRALGAQQIRLPFCETAGETFSLLLDRFGRGQYDLTPDMKDASLIKNYILDTDAIVLIAPVTRPLGLEREVGAKINLPDVNLARLCACIHEYKQQDSYGNPGHRPIRGIAVFLTKYDAVKDFCEAKGMNLETHAGVHAFMSQYFPETYAVLGWYGLDNVRFWPTGVQIETRQSEVTGQLEAFPHPLNPARGWKIQVDPHRKNVPVYTADPFYAFIEWLQKTVMT